MRELLSAGFTVTVLGRSASTLSSLPAEIKVIEVDYSSSTSLQQALVGQDVLVACLAMDAMSIQPTLIDAAIRAGVRRYIPSEYSGITLDTGGAAKLPLLAPVIEVQRLVKEVATQGKISFTILAPGGFIGMSLDGPVLLDWSTGTAELVDGGLEGLSVSKLETIAHALVAVLRDEERYKNEIVKFHDGVVTQSRALELAKKVRPDVQWRVTELDSAKAIEQGLAALKSGSFTQEGAMKLLVANTFAKGHHMAWTKEEDQSQVLGLKVLGDKGLESLIEKKARGEMVGEI